MRKNKFWLMSMVFMMLFSLSFSGTAMAEDVPESPLPVIHSIGGPTELGLGEMGTWMIDASIDDNSSLTYSVVWGDEQAADGTDSLARESVQTVTFTHVYNTVGNYAPMFEVSNAAGQSVEASLSVNVTTSNEIETGSMRVYVVDGDIVCSNMVDYLECGLIYGASVSLSSVASANLETLEITDGPVLFDNLSFSSYIVTAEADGYENGVEDFTISSVDEEYIIIRLARQVLPGKNHNPEIIDYSVPEKVTVGETFKADWQATDEDNDALSWSVNWGDSSVDSNAASLGTCSESYCFERSTTHVYDSAGIYVAKVQVKDSNGALAEIQHEIKAVVGDSCDNLITVVRPPTRDKYWEKLHLDTSAHPEILKYKIQWFSGVWSDWFTLGEDDLDWKTNYDGTQRRVWSYFTDHTHKIVMCGDDTVTEGLPDLVIEGMRFVSGDSFNSATNEAYNTTKATEKNKVSIYVKIKNKGKVATGPFVSKAIYGEDDYKIRHYGSVQPRKHVQIGPMKDWVLFDKNVNLSVGTDIVFKADYEDDVRESNENNNAIEQEFRGYYKSDDFTVKPSECPAVEAIQCGVGEEVTTTFSADGCAISQCSMPSEYNKLQQLIKKLQYKVTQLEKKVVEAEKALSQAVDKKLTERLKGKILLQVDNNGEAWYIDEKTEKRFYLKDGDTAYTALRVFGLGITNNDISEIPIGIEDRAVVEDTDNDGLPDKLEETLGTDIENPDTDGDGHSDGQEVKLGYNPLGSGQTIVRASAASNLEGKILLQVEDKGQAWYVHDGKRYYMKDGAQAYQLMRYKSLGVANNDIRKISVGEFEE